jgi:hypothetical protein
MVKIMLADRGLHRVWDPNYSRDVVFLTQTKFGVKEEGRRHARKSALLVTSLEPKTVHIDVHS